MGIREYEGKRRSEVIGRPVPLALELHRNKLSQKQCAKTNPSLNPELNSKKQKESTQTPG